jgi:maltose alpha-D-glucosyltransferase/alpha-amylase
VPRLAGYAGYERGGETATLAVLQELVPTSGDGWAYLVSALTDRGPAVARRPDPLVEDVRRLGAITGGLHAALAADPTDPDFRPEPIDRDDVARWREAIAGELAAVDLPRRLPGPERDVPGRAARTLAALEDLVGAAKIRIHGDYHLGQVLKTPGGFAIIDFEGEPARPLAERRRKQPALRDVAGMLRSLDYAAHAVAFGRPAAERAGALAVLTAWEEDARRAFLAGYHAAAMESAAPLVPADPAALPRACAPFELQKACYELRYELDNRPDWVAIPLAGIERIVARASAAG